MKREDLSAPPPLQDISPLRYFIADLHLDGEDTPRAQAFHQFLKKIAETTAHGPVELFIVGDLFQFWYEYKPQLFEIYARDLEALETAWKAGVKIYLFFGNRDFIYGAYVHKRFGATVLGDGQDIHMSDHRRAWVEHGDLLCTQDKRYLKFRKRIRSRPVRWLFKLMPWSMAKKMIERIRTTTLADKNKKKPEEFGIDLAAARARLEEHKCQLLICGHTHTHQTEDLGAGMRLVVLPPWCEHPAGYVDDGHTFKSFEV
ncbi:MAG TPA: UDP-2,3-diacylglucosamine diphosphatase [Planctomycetota bacterium]|nr:UDP-2,3-diacylglucosamine diphosphatase [Planctomycetota bacterium]